MADDNDPRYRPNDQFGRGPAPGGQGSDPLAELARLIGRNDPFSDHGRDSRAPVQHNTDPRYGHEPAPQYGQEPAQRYSEVPPQRYASDEPRRYGGDPNVLNDWPGSPSPHQTQNYDPFSSPPAPPPQHAPMAADPHYDSRGYVDPHGQPVADPYHSDHPGYDPAPYQQGADYHAAPPPLYPNEPDIGAMPPPHDDEFYDDAPRGDRRKGLVTVLAVLGLAVLGTAGAFGYRSYFGGASSSSPPPVIRASGEPTKVAPPPSDTDALANKINYDRFGDRGQNEQVVVRQEKPVDPKELGRSTAVRTVLPGAPIANVPPPPPPRVGPNANPPSAIGEPRRVRTVPIRPDQPEPAGTPQSIAAQPPATSVAPPRQTTVAAAPAANPPAPPPRVAPRPAPPPPAATRAPSTRVASRAPPSTNAPLSLSPDGNNSLPPPAASPAPPPRTARAPTRLTPPASGGGNGRYLVQVSSQRSEADAQASFRNIQAKYSGVLGGQPHVVRRANLGSKGIYYRAMVGPFGSRDEAIQLCTSLKAAGGNCLIQTN